MTQNPLFDGQSQYQWRCLRCGSPIAMDNPGIPGPGLFGCAKCVGSLFDGLVHTLEGPWERPTGGVNDESADACPVTMPPGAPDDTPAPSPSELHITPHLDHVVQFFKARPYQWISALTLERIAGRLSWRTRVSECRTIALMRITNRLRHGKNPTTHERWCVSEYRYEP